MSIIKQDNYTLYDTELHKHKAATGSKGCQEW